MTSSLVFMHDALSDHFVDHRQCLNQCAAGAIGVLGFYCTKNSLNVSSHRGARLALWARRFSAWRARFFACGLLAKEVS